MMLGVEQEKSAIDVSSVLHLHYEIYEWVVDHWFGQNLFIGETDTVTDLADGFLGAALGGLFLAAWALTRYTSRRLPRPIRTWAVGS